MNGFMTKYLIFCVSWYHTDEFCLLCPVSNHLFCPDFVNLYVKLVLHHGSSKVKSSNVSKVPSQRLR